MEDKIKATYVQAASLLTELVDSVSDVVLDCSKQEEMTAKELLDKVNSKVVDVILEALDIPDVKEELRNIAKGVV